MNKCLKVLLSTAVAAGLVSGVVLADQTTDDLLLNATVVARTSVTYNVTSVDLGDAGITGKADVKIAELEITGNDPDGYDITFTSSAVQGFPLISASALTLDGVASANIAKEGNHLDYTIKLADKAGQSGTIDAGSVTNAFSSLAAISDSVKLYSYSTPDQATDKHTLDLHINFDAKGALFRGSYADTINVVIVDK